MVNSITKESKGVNNTRLSSENIKNEMHESTNKYLHTKFLVPRNADDCLCRKHLLEKMNGITDKKLSLVTGPAGYGKTTLVSMWLMQNMSTIKSCWVSIDENDNNVLRFWHYIIASINRSITGYMDEDAIIYQDSPNCSFEIMLSGLINWLSEIHYDIVLVIDDYHLICNGSIHESMQYFINHMPENMHIVIISRIIPHMKFARLRGNDKLLELKTEELKLNYCEIREFLERTMKLNLSEDEVKKLEKYTEGWIAALKLTAMKIKSSNTNEHLSDNFLMNEFVIDYMSEEAFSLLNKETMDFLQKTSILDTLNRSLCDEVADICNSQDIINNLEKNNVFITALDDEKINYRYHSLFSEFLRKRLSKTNAGMEGMLYLKASNWYEKNNMIPEALENSEKSNNHQNTVRLVEKYGEIMIINRDFLRIEKLIRALPEEIVSQNPRLCVLYTFAATSQNNADSDIIMVGKIPVNLKSNVFSEYKMDLLLIRMMLAYDNNDFLTSLKYAEQVPEIMTNKSIIQCIPYKILCHIYCKMGNSTKAKHYLNLYIRAVRNLNYFESSFIDTLHAHLIVKVHCCVGDYKNALDIIRNFELKMNADNLSMPTIANSIYLDLGYLYYEYNKLELSCKSAKKCIEICRIKMDVFRLISGYILKSSIMKSMRRYDEAVEYIRRSECLCDKYNVRIIIISLFMYIVRTLLHLGETDYVEYLIDKYNITVQESFDVEYEDVHLALADLHISKGEYEKAMYILDKLYEKVKWSERNHKYVRILILKALVSRGMGNDTEAMGYMKSAIEHAVEQGYINTFADFGVPAAEIICKMLKKSTAEGTIDEKYISYASSLLSSIKKLPNPGFKIDTELMKYLSRRELEVLESMINGLTNKEIASTLFIAECTVKKHINNIYSKIGVVNRDQAMQICEKLTQ